MSNLLEVEDLTIQYKTRDASVQAVTDATFSVEENQFVGLIGESGSGKTTIGEAILGLMDDNGEIASGKVRYKGEEIQDYSEEEFQSKLRWSEISLIPQASMNSLDPIDPLDQQAIELAKTHTDWSKQKILTRLQELFEIVGLPADRITDYPFQFSGGMQQRAVIAFSLLLDPEIIIADEPTTALDVIMQDQIFKYINQIKDENDTSMILITHDISVVFENCDTMVLLHSGHIAERGNIKEIYRDPRHPYSILLEESFPDIRSPDKSLAIIDGKPPVIQEGVDMCTFAERCPWANDDCFDELPNLEPVAGDENHYTSCIRAEELDALVEGSDVAGDD